MKDRKITASFLHKYYENEAIEENRQEKMYGTDIYHSYWQNVRLNEIIKTFKKIGGGNFLEVGCAEGLYIRIFKDLYENINTFGLDISHNYLKKIRAGNNDQDTSLIQGDANSLPFKENYFDIILCSETLEHVLDPKSSFCELYRVSKKYIIISIPGHTPFFFIGRCLGVIKNQDISDSFSSPGKGHINELDIGLLKKYLSEINGKYDITEQKTYCYIPPEIIKKCHVPLQLIRFIDKIINYIPFLNSFGLVQILVIEKK